MISNNLIEKALALTGKTRDDICFWDDYYGPEESIEKFCYYLLSPEFIEKFAPIFIYNPITAQLIGEAIYEYQKGNEQPLISLLEKIG